MRLLHESSPLQTFYCVCERRLFCLSRARADQSPRPCWSFSDQPAARRGAGSGPHPLPSPLLSFSLLSSADSSLPSLLPSSPVLSPSNPCSLLSPCKEKSKKKDFPTNSDKIQSLCLYWLMWLHSHIFIGCGFGK